jgi:hypothetical protein
LIDEGAGDAATPRAANPQATAPIAWRLRNGKIVISVEVDAD